MFFHLAFESLVMLFGFGASLFVEVALPCVLYLKGVEKGWKRGVCWGLIALVVTMYAAAPVSIVAYIRENVYVGYQ